MVSKKYTVLIALLLTFGVSAFAQTSVWDWKDSSVVPVKSITQFNEFKQNKNPFPPMPRNAWEIGLGLGASSVTGDLSAKTGLGLSVTLRKALNNTFSYRLGYFYSYNVGGDGTFHNYDGTVYNRATGVGNSFTSELQNYWSNPYKNYSHNAAIDFIASLNTVSNYRGDPISNLYAFGGVGITASSTEVLVKGTSSYVFQRGIPGSQLLSSSGKTIVFTTFDLGLGYAYKLNNKINIGIEERIISPVKHVNYVQGFNTQTGTKNIYYFTALKLNYNLL